VGTVALTGSASGIGAATRERLVRDGHAVIGVDLHDADVVADLATEAGRAAMIAEVDRLSGGVLDGVVACAGVFDATEDRIVATNFFGATATLDGLRPMLERGERPSAVAVSSNSTTVMPGIPMDLVEHCLAGDEAAATGLAPSRPGYGYACSKMALAHWVRREAVTDRWAGAGIRLNAIAPGLVDTPLNEGRLEMFLSLGDVFPVPQRRAAAPEEIASLLAFLLSDEASFFCGSVIFVDGGSDAAMRPDAYPTPMS
jgi:NAD(P)-dependent dehydrogenase (short-subunit alcohol dehydrogenase family)